MKVSEAKEKICPFMSDNTMGRDYNGDYNGVSYCVCGDCMAWVYTKENKTKEEQLSILNDEEKRYYKETIKYYYSVNSVPNGDIIKDKKLIEIIEKMKKLELYEDEKEGYCIRLLNKKG